MPEISALREAASTLLAAAPARAILAAMRAMLTDWPGVLVWLLLCGGGHITTPRRRRLLTQRPGGR
jgi:hypothetical protein